MLAIPARLIPSNTVKTTDLRITQTAVRRRTSLR